MTYALTIFSHSGKNYIGNIITFTGSESIACAGGLTVNSSSNYYAILSPCELEFELKENAGASSHIALKKMMPIIPGKLCSNGGDNAVFAFLKTDVVLSNITNAQINTDLITAYRQMTSCTKGG